MPSLIKEHKVPHNSSNSPNGGQFFVPPFFFLKIYLKVTVTGRVGGRDRDRENINLPSAELG